MAKDNFIYVMSEDGRSCCAMPRPLSEKERAKRIEKLKKFFEGVDPQELIKEGQEYLSRYKKIG